MFLNYTNKKTQLSFLCEPFRNSIKAVAMGGVKYFLSGLLTFFFIGLGQVASAHGDLDEKIDAVSEEIKVQRDSAYLYFKRGKLYFQHSEFQEAIEDMQETNKLGYQDILCDLIFAQSYQALEKYDEAFFYVEKIQNKNPTHLIATKIKAEVLFQQKKFKASAINFEKVIKHSRKRLPEHYLAAAKSWESLNTQKGHKKALSILAKGKEDLGTLFIFQETEIALYIKAKAYKKALLVQEAIIKTANRKEIAYYKAAEICLLSNNKKEAADYLQQSLASLDRLSPSKKNNKAMMELRQNIKNQMKLL